MVFKTPGVNLFLLVDLIYVVLLVRSYYNELGRRVKCTFGRLQMNVDN